MYCFQVWNDRHAEAEVVPSLTESLARLKLDYIDLYLVHWPCSANVSFLVNVIIFGKHVVLPVVLFLVVLDEGKSMVKNVTNKGMSY